MVINDHINLIPNPLIGPNIEELGPRFPDMKGAYDPSLIALATEIAGKEGIKLQYGCYVGLTGPTFETPQEYHYVRAIGGDAVGMSTTPEIIAARHMGIPCFGVSTITDLASDDSVSHEVVQAGTPGREGDNAPVHRDACRTLEWYVVRRRGTAPSGRYGFRMR